MRGQCQKLPKDGAPYQFEVCTDGRRFPRDIQVTASLISADGKLDFGGEIVLDRVVAPPRLGPKNDTVAYYVAMIEVAPEHEGRALGTRLWERAAKLACHYSDGQPMQSGRERSHFAEAFWRKQEAKGRAQCLPPTRPGRTGMLYPDPLRKIQAKYEAGKISEKQYLAMTRNLPRAEGITWPCERWALTSCGSQVDLDGLRFTTKRRRQRRRRR